MNVISETEDRAVCLRWRLVSMSIALWALASFMVVQAGYPVVVTRAAADSLIVNSSADTWDGVCDSNHCTLREALDAVGGGETTISFDLSTPATISLTDPLTVSANMEAGITIMGPGSDLLTIDGGGTYRPFFIEIPTLNNVDISGLTIANGQADNGGGIYSSRLLTLSDVKFVGNSATGDGGAIYYTSSDTLNLTDVTITGNHADGNGGGVFSNRAVTMNNVTLAGNTTTGNGGGFYSDNTATINDVIITGNSATGNGGGIFNAFNRSLNANNLILSGNSATDGGGLHMFDGSVGLTDSTIDNNTATGSGGGIFIRGGEGSSGQVTLTRSTLHSNSAASGGGLFNLGAQADLINSTVSGNNATGDGGGIANQPHMLMPSSPFKAITRLASSTITDNSAGGNGGGIANDDGILESKNSIIAGNSNSSGTVPDCTRSGFAIFMTDYTLVGNDSGCDFLFSQGTGNFVGDADSPIDAKLGQLSDNGGATQTHALLAINGGSLARDNGDPAGCTDLSGTPLTTDQRGAPRTQDSDGDGIADCDMGAYETGLDNDTWPRALTLTLGGSATEPTATKSQMIEKPGQSRWYKFSVFPGSTVQVNLTDLPANYDITIYKDIQVLHDSLITPASNQDLVQLTAEFAPEAFAPEAFAVDAFAPEAFAPEAFAPEAFAPEAFAPEAFAPEAFAPEAFAADAFAPEAFAPEAFAPEAFAANLAYVSAQIRSLIGVSAFDGIADEAITVDTWDNSGDFYVRVRGRNGAFDPTAEYNLEVTQFIGTCQGVDFSLTGDRLTGEGGGYRTLILADFERMDTLDPQMPLLQDKLQAFAKRDEIDGVVVDVGLDGLVAAANMQADTFTTCPAAKNLVANAIKDIIDSYKTFNPLEYIVIIGNDDVIPFFRHPDRALLANEKNYVPPVADDTTSYSSLILGYVLSQDLYGSDINLSLSNTTLPIPKLAVGRLVETPADIIAMLDAYQVTVTANTPGQVPIPQTALVTGYDFLEDAALAIQAEFEAGINASSDTLIAPSDLSPLSDDPRVWTGNDLRAELLTNRHDLIFLAGHFSAHSALAADYSTRLLASEVASSSVDLQNALIFSAGCHSGYNIVNEHGIPNLTQEPDWAQAFAQKGATLIAGTGYQYGDTEFLEYSERLYLNFSQQLLVGTGPVAIGDALVAAKQTYLAETAQLRGIHEKSLLQATLYGLPMLSINMPSGRNTPTDPPSIAGMPQTVQQDPGQTLGLQVSDIIIDDFSLTLNEVTLESVSDNSTVTASYLSGTDGVVSNPAEPVLPIERRNVNVPDTVLRGAGFRSGSYIDRPNIVPLTGAPTTEIRGVHPPFQSEIFFPVQPWRVNYFDLLADPTGGIPRLTITPAQFVSDEATSMTGTLRQWDSMGFRLYYSDNTKTFDAGSVPATASPPSITKVEATSTNGNVDFRIVVVGDPAAGIHEVWVTYTICTNDICNGSWQPLDLTQNVTNSTVWEESLTLSGLSASDVRYMVQAVNGVGLVSLNTNLGAYYVSDIDPGDLTSGGDELTQPATTALAFQSSPTSGAYNTEASFSAQLTSEGSPLANQVIKFALGSQQRSATTNSNGQATVSIPLLVEPGDIDVRVTFAGSTDYQASEATDAFTILKQPTQIALSPLNAVVQVGASPTMIATLTDANGTRLREKGLFFIVSDNSNTYSISAITDLVGAAQLGPVPLPAGSYEVDVYFSGMVPLPSDTLNIDDVNYLPAVTSGTLTLIDANSVPVAVNDSYSTDENRTLTVAAPGVLGNDSDGDGDMLIAALNSSPSHGTLSLKLDGSFEYTPTTDYVGSDSFTYLANDGVANSNVATVMIAVTEASDSFATCGDFDVFEIAVNQYEAPGFEGNLIVGTNGYDWLRGSNGPDLILGLGGPDDIFGRGDNDIICGGQGVDIIQGGSGNDIIYGNEHADLLIGGNGHDIVYGGPGWDDIEGNSGKDQLFGEAGYDVLLGGNGNDELDGGIGPDDLYGGSGNDALSGGQGNDLLLGNNGNDELYGEEGNDILKGGRGRDFCSGGLGNDSIVQCEGNSSDDAAEILLSDAGHETIDVDMARRANDNNGEYTITRRIQELFLPLISTP